MVERRIAMNTIWTKEFWKATLVRLIRTFLTTILGVWTAGQLITTVDWKQALLAAASATVYILILCLLSGLPEVKEGSIEDKQELPEGYFEEEKEVEDE